MAQPSSIGAQVRFFRRRRGVPQSVLAGLVERSERWLREVESGRTDPRIHEIAALAAALRIDAAKLLEAGPSPLEDDPLKRRDFLEAAGAIGAGGMLLGGLSHIDWERLASLPGQLDGRVLDDLEEMTREFARRSHKAQPGTLLVQVHSHLSALKPLLGESRPEQLQRRLQTIAGETARLAGWLGYLTESRGVANAYYDFGIDLARQAGEGQLLARILVAKSLLYSSLSQDMDGAGGTAATVLGFLDEAVAAASSEAPARLRSWILERRAEEHAAGGHVEEAFRDLENAERVIDSSFGEGLPTNWDSIWFDVYRAGVYRIIGQPREAIPLLESALKDIDPGLLYDQSVFLTSLAATCIRLDPPDVDQAAATLIRALEFAIHRRLAGRVQRIFAVRRRLTPWQDASSVRSLDEQLQTARW